MRILINGLPLFSRRLAADLKEFDPHSSFVFCDTYHSKLEQLKFLALLPFADAVLSMNGVTDDSGSLNAVLRLKKKLILQWQGTDALLALERNKNGSIKRDYIDYAHNLTDAPWLREEVAQLGISAEMAYFKSTPKLSPLTRYDEISVMSYIPEKRQDFYGIKHLIELAESHPDIKFRIFASKGSALKTPSNIIFMGWCSHDEFLEFLKKTPIFLRLTEHDGFPAPVIEAMSLGCEVLMTMPFEKARTANSITDIKSEFEAILKTLTARTMTPNLELIEWTRLTFDKEHVIKTYLERLRSIVSS